MKLDKKYMPVAVSLGIAGVLLCFLMVFVIFAAGSKYQKSEFKLGEVVKVSGKVMGFSDACAYDAQCGLTIEDSNYGSVFVVTATGLTPYTCSNQNSLSMPLSSYIGIRIEARGKVTGERTIHPCSSSEYIRFAKSAE